MNANLHKYFMELRKTQKARKRILISCGSCLSCLKIISALSIYNSELGAAVWLKEIQR